MERASRIMSTREDPCIRADCERPCDVSRISVQWSLCAALMAVQLSKTFARADDGCALPSRSVVVLSRRDIDHEARRRMEDSTDARPVHARFQTLLA